MNRLSHLHPPPPPLLRLKSLPRLHVTTTAFNPHLRHPTESNSPLLRVLGSFKSPNYSNKRGPYFFRRFFCSDSGEGSDPAAESGAETRRVETDGEDSDSKSSSAIVPTVFKPEDCLTVLALPLPHRPLFPGFYMPIYLKDPKLLAALVESRKRQAPFAGAFLVKEEPGMDPASVSGSDTEKNIYELKGKELLDRLHEVGTLAQITSIQGDQVVLIGHRRIRISELVDEDPLTVKIDHLKEKPYDRDDDVMKATSFEVISTLKDVLKTSSLWRDHVQTYTQHIGDFNYARLADFGAAISGANKLQCILDIITKQHWSQLLPLLKPTTPSNFLQQLFDYNFPSASILTFFRWSQHGLQVSHSLQHLCKLLTLLANDKKYSKIRSLLHFYVECSQPFSISSFFHTLVTCSDDFCGNSIIVDMLILALVNNGKLDLAVEGFRRAGDYGFKLSVISCNPMLGGLVKKRKVGTMEFVFREMIKRRIEVNVISFNMVINGFCKAGKLNKAGDVVEDMKVFGIMPNVVTYNTLIGGFCKKGGAGKMYKADALLKEMVEKDVRPSEITYNVLIDGFCKDDNVVAALKLFKEMQAQQLNQSVAMFNLLINGLCGEGKIDEALGLRDEMVGLGLEPNIMTYNVILNGFCKKKMLEEAREMFDDVVKRGVKVNALTFNTLIDAYCKAGKMDEATALRDLMSTQKVCPSVSTYNCFIGGYFREGNLEEANKLLEEMEEEGLRADLITYNIRIDALCKRGESRKAVRLLDEISEKGLIPSHITYNTLMAGYCREGNPTAALVVRRRMEKEGKRPNVVSYNVLIKGFCEKGKLEEANAYLNEMLETGLVPNRTTYEIIREEMMEKGFVPDIDGHLYADSLSA